MTTTAACINKWNPIWNVITLSKSLTKKQIVAVKRIDYFVQINDNCIVMHGGVATLTDRVNRVLEIVADRKEKSIRFTDEQFGRGRTSYNGVALPNAALSHEIVVKSGMRITTIPITCMQIENSK